MKKEEGWWREKGLPRGESSEEAAIVVMVQASVR